MTNISKIAFYHKKIYVSKVRAFISPNNSEKLVHAFISSSLDYCNALVAGLSKQSVGRLQLIQNAAARVLTRTRTFEHITPVLKSLHWLPVQHRITFKILLTVYKARNGLAPQYISDLLTVHNSIRPLRSSGRGLPSCTQNQTQVR